MDWDQIAPIGAVCSGSTLFASMLNFTVLLGNYLQQTTSADDFFRCIFFLGALRVKSINSHRIGCNRKRSQQSANTDQKIDGNRNFDCHLTPVRITPNDHTG